MPESAPNIQAELIGALASIKARAATARQLLASRPDLNGRSSLRSIEEQADDALAHARAVGLIVEAA